ncbi:hypothetical protein LTR66_006903 [Elasticomyces elasticus]|nr:hypothetical protein LTR66_006903 [Elasticomyces elasticus]
MPPRPVRIRRKSHTMITRSATAAIRKSFPFLQLAPELRNMIYELCLNLDGVDAYFARYAQAFKKDVFPDKVRPPVIRCTTPTVLLICRQIFMEAITYLAKQRLVFTHGLFAQKLSKVVSTGVIRKITHLTISDSNLDMERSNYPDSIQGLLALFREICDILKSGHHLKEFKIIIKDDFLSWHLGHCWDAVYKCGFCDHIRYMLRALDKVRGVGRVIFEGRIPYEQTRRLIARMQTQKFPFLKLPTEVRELIYNYSANWNDVSVELPHFLNDWKQHGKPRYGRLTTPTVLLINRQITSEALRILHKKRFVFNATESFHMLSSMASPQITRFIGKQTLQKLTHVTLNLSCGEWVCVIQDLAMIWTMKHALKELHIHIEDELKREMVARGREYPDKELWDSLKHLKNLSGIDMVTFSGDLPQHVTEPLKTKMEVKHQAGTKSVHEFSVCQESVETNPEVTSAHPKHQSGWTSLPFSVSRLFES